MHKAETTVCLNRPDLTVVYLVTVVLQDNVSRFCAELTEQPIFVMPGRPHPRTCFN